MTEHLFGFISGIVAGIVTNGIQGVFHYITKETLQDHITNTIGAVQLLYENEFGCKDKSLFIWQKNIEYYTLWLQEGFLPREDAIPPVPYGEDKEQTKQNQNFKEVPVQEILKELGLPYHAELGNRDIVLLDGFDGLCMMDGMTEFAEQILSETGTDADDR